MVLTSTTNRTNSAWRQLTHLMATGAGAKKHVLVAMAAAVVAGCTTLESHMSIVPYTKNKTLRNVLEQAAEAYCQKKRAGTSSATSATQPDLIFTTDGCTRWPDDSWVECCIVHDIAYWCGGSEQDRKGADRDLQLCVNRKAAMIGNVMYPGVRAAGSPWLPTPWRWGYGWSEWPKG